MAYSALKAVSAEWRLPILKLIEQKRPRSVSGTEAVFVISLELLGAPLLRVTGQVLAAAEAVVQRRHPLVLLFIAGIAALVGAKLLSALQSRNTSWAQRGLYAVLLLMIVAAFSRNRGRW